MTALLALASALIIGSSDFLLGLGARSAQPIRVPIASNVASAFMLLILAPFFPASSITSGAMLWGVLSGLAGSIGFTLYLYALRDGKMSIAAPVTATLTALILVATGVATGDRLTVLATAGVVAAILAGILISRAEATEEDGPHAQRSVYLAVGAGLVFAVFFWSLSQIPDTAGMWPLIAARGISFCFQVSLALIVTKGISVSRQTLRTTIPAGTLEAIAVVLATEALRRGPLSVAGVVTGLFPISTVLLAWLVLKERLERVQWLAVGLALAAVPLTAL